MKGKQDFIKNKYCCVWKRISECRKQAYGYQGGERGRDKLGDWNRHIYSTIYKTDNS